MKLVRTLVACAAALAALAILPASGLAAQSLYPPDPQARTFAGGDGGWTASVSYSGPCVPPVVCPAISGTVPGDGGAGGSGDGHLRTGFTGVLGLLVSSSSGIWRSPEFTYSGVSGKVPDAVELRLKRRADVADLLGIGSTITYSVELVDSTDPSGSLVLVDAANVEQLNEWTTAESIAIPPGQLTVGHSYRVQITTTFATGILSALLTGNADYDDIVLRASTSGSGGGGADGGGGGNGGGAGDDGNRRAAGPAAIAGKSAVLRRGKLRVRVRCARRAESRCRMRVVALLRKRGPRISRAKRVRVRPGARRRVTLRLRRGYRAKVAARKRVFVKLRVRAVGRKHTQVKRLRVRRGR